METDETDTTIALQPETEIEQSLLAELFTRLNNVAHDAPNHPSKVGSTMVYYTLDVPEYDGLDSDLWDEAECGVNEHGQLDPEPGSRALIVVHTREEGEAGGEATQEDVDEAVEMMVEDAEEREVAEPPFDPGAKTVSELEDALGDGDDLTAAELRGLYEAEVNGEARKTALEGIEEMLNELVEGPEAAA